MDRPTCEGLRKDGGRCRSFSLPASAHCFLHGDPEAARAARSKGSVNAGKLRALQGRRRRLDCPAAVVGFLSNLVHDVAEKRVDAEVAKVLTYALSVQIKAIELAEASEGRRLLDQVEALAKQARQAR